MDSNTISQQVTSIVRQLTALQETMTVSVVSKCFPRLGPAEAGTGYQQAVSRFAPAEFPEALRLPDGTDEVVITLEGMLRAPKDRRQLVDEVSDFLGTTGLDVDWDFRALADAAAGGGFDKAFELTLFTNFFGPCVRDGAD